MIVTDEQGNKWEMTPIQEGETLEFKTLDPILSATLSLDDNDFPFELQVLLDGDSGAPIKGSCWITTKRGLCKGLDFDNELFLKAFAYGGEITGEFVSENDEIYSYSETEISTLRRMLQRACKLEWI